MEESHYWDLIGRHLAGKATPSEEEHLMHWVGLKPENKAFFEWQKKLWRHSAENPIDFKTDHHWEMLRRDIESQQHMKRSGSMGFVLKIAASLLLFVLIGVLTKSLLVNDDLLTASAPEDRNIEMKLPDGSKVWLNKKAEIKYPPVFEGQQRKIYLTGEAFFEIQPDKTKPFIIDADGLLTEVVGTSFNVRAFENEDSIKVSVLTGKVLFYKSGNVDGGVLLLPGQEGVYSRKAGAILKSTVENENFLSWKTGRLKFENTPIREVIAAIGNFYGKEIVLKNKNLEDCPITTKMENQPLDKVLKELQILLNIDYEIQHDQIVISGGSCY